MAEELTDPDGDERATLVSFLAYVRAVAVAKLAALPDELARRRVEPSGLSLLGLCQHLTQVERWWFQRVLLGEELDFPWSDEDPDAEFRVAPDQTVAATLAEYEAANRRSSELLALHHLDDCAAFVPSSFPGGVVRVRWIGWHVVEETSRHNGHLDLVREQLDGRTGEF